MKKKECRGGVPFASEREHKNLFLSFTIILNKNNNNEKEKKPVVVVVRIASEEKKKRDNKSVCLSLSLSS